MKKSADINYFLKHAWSKRKETYESSHLSEYINNQALRMLDHVQKYSFSNTRVVASSTNFQYLARDVGFDFTPEEFNFSDENLSVEVGPLEYNHFEITFTNKSDSFLEVTDLAGYYGERVEILLPTRMRSQFTLPPGSTLKETYGWLSLSNVHRDISKAPIQYGYSTAYALRNQSSKTLKEVKDYSVDNF